MAKKKKSYVKVWAGRFDTAERRIAYFHETYDDGDEDGEPPISEFAAGQDESFYDHDELEINFRTEIEPEFRSLLEPCSFSSSYLDAALTAYEAGAEPVNLLVLYFGEELGEPRSVSGPEFALRYLGRFVYDEDADSAEAERLAAVPSEVLLELQSPGEALWNGTPAGAVRVTKQGLAIGCGAPSAGTPYLDLAGLPDTKGVAALQLRIYRDEWDQWVLEDLGDNGLTSVGATVLNGERAMPWHGIVIHVGPVRLRWNCFPKQTED